MIAEARAWAQRFYELAVEIRDLLRKIERQGREERERV